MDSVETSVFKDLCNLMSIAVSSLPEPAATEASSAVFSLPRSDGENSVWPSTEELLLILGIANDGHGNETKE